MKKKIHEELHHGTQILLNVPTIDGIVYAISSYAISMDDEYKPISYTEWQSVYETDYKTTSIRYWRRYL